MSPEAGSVTCEGQHEQHAQHAPLTTLLALERTIQQRRRDMEQQKGGHGMVRQHNGGC